MLNPTLSSNKSSDGADLLKYLMAICVVAMHTQLFSGVLYPITRLAVPVFFLLSGYFFFSKQKTLDSRESEKHFKARIKRIVQLYSFWFVVLLPLTVYIRKYYQGGVVPVLLRLTKDILFNSTFQASWYLSATVIGLAVVYFLSKKLGNMPLIVIGALFYVPALLSSNYIFLVESNEASLGIYNSLKDVFGLFCRNFAVSIVYFAAAKIIAERDTEKMKLPGLLVGFGISFALLIGECLIISKSGVTVHDNDCFIMLVPTAVFLCLIALRSEVRVTHAKLLREMSILIYCLHMPVYMVIGKLFSVLNIPDVGNILVCFVTVAATQLFALIILRLEKVKPLSFLKLSH